MFATIASLRNAQFAKNQAQATKLAQEGIERVRTGRDRNLSINNIPLVIPFVAVSSWNGTTAAGTCTLLSNTSNADSIWCYQIYNGCGSGLSGTACYFKLMPNPNTGIKDGTISYFTSSTTFPSGAEDVYGDGKFKRAIIFSDDVSAYKLQKTVTVIVAWTDFSGKHESRLTTILRKL